MKQLLLELGVVLVLLAVVLGLMWGCYQLGVTRGELGAKARCQNQQIDQLTRMATTQASAVAQSLAADAALRDMLATRGAIDTQTTRDLKNALAKTAGSRADCRFDDDSMRQLKAARDRAASAAASGFRQPVPAPG